MLQPGMRFTLYRQARAKQAHSRVVSQSSAIVTCLMLVRRNPEVGHAKLTSSVEFRVCTHDWRKGEVRPEPSISEIASSLVARFLLMLTLILSVVFNNQASVVDKHLLSFNLETAKISINKIQQQAHFSSSSSSL